MAPTKARPDRQARYGAVGGLIEVRLGAEEYWPRVFEEISLAGG
jgi:hypothetical protein